IKIGKGEFILTPKRIETIQGRPFIIMPYCENGSLRDLIKNHTISKERAFEIITQIAIGMYRIGDKENLVHQDLKPENILFDKNDHVLISDLGLVRAINASNADNKEIGISQTTAGGTLPYCSPEQLMNDSKLDQRIDIYAIGLIFYEMLTGEYAVMGKTEEEFYKKILRDTPPLLNDISNKYGKECVSFIEKCIHKDRSKRPQNFHQLCLELDLLIKPGVATKKLTWWKKDNRINITDSKTIDGWGYIFEDRLQDRTKAAIKYTDIRLLQQAKDLRALGDFKLAIKKCNKLLGNAHKSDSNICITLLKIDRAQGDESFKYIEFIKQSGTGYKISADIGLIVEATEFMMACYIDLIELTNKQTDVKDLNQLVDLILQYKNIPNRILILCAQAKIKSEEYGISINILSGLSETTKGAMLHKVLAIYAVALHSANRIDELVELINTKTLPILGEHESNIAQKYCGQALAMLNRSDIAVHYFLKAFELDQNDIWSLKQAGLCYLNLEEVDRSIAVHVLLTKISPKHPFTIDLGEDIERVEAMIENK
ncbi:MAG: serine/threonine-protein kinase, partial [Pseudomonadota bacterium]